MTKTLARFDEVWLVDFLQVARPGERRSPICMVARQYGTGRILQLWREQLEAQRVPPYPLGPQALFVTYDASTALSCHLALGWKMPERILDLFAEFRCLTNGPQVPCGDDLFGAMTYCGLDPIDCGGGTSVDQILSHRGSYSEDERALLLEHSEAKVAAMEKLLESMTPYINFHHATLRGRYMAAVARMEWNGTPIDVPTYRRLRATWRVILDRLIQAVDQPYGVFDGRDFDWQRWSAWLVRNDIPWPGLASGYPDISDDTFRQMARCHPEVAPVRELLSCLRQPPLSDLAVGSDGRNRCSLSPFRSVTGRNQPSSTKFIFGSAVWRRSLIKPQKDLAVAYLDYEQQEFGIAAALSRDSAMRAAYTSGDPYLGFAKQVGAVPADATKETHKQQRDLFKACVLGVQYGMGAQSLAERLGQPTAIAEELLRLYKETYARCREWVEEAKARARLRGWLDTTFGWRIHVDQDTRDSTLENFPMQANGAEMLRLACCLATERGIRVCAPVHDALLIEAPVNEIDQAVAETQAAMAEASEIVLDGFTLRIEEEIVRYPGRYMDPRGKRFWNEVMNILANLPHHEPGPSVVRDGGRPR